MDDHLEGSQGTGGLIPKAQINEVLKNLNVSHFPFTSAANFKPAEEMKFQSS